MKSEYGWEPVKGLPGHLPPGETILWQGSPGWRGLALSVFHARLVAVWFVALAALAFAAGGTGWTGALVTLAVAAAGLAVLGGLAWLQARTTIYTLTDKRVVMRFGVALNKCVNIPLKEIASAGAKPAGPGLTDIALKTVSGFPLAWLQMWPHVKPWEVKRPEPMLRAVPDSFAPLFAKALADADPARSRPVATEAPADAPSAEPIGVAA